MESESSWELVEGTTTLSVPSEMDIDSSEGTSSKGQVEGEAAESPTPSAENIPSSSPAPEKETQPKEPEPVPSVADPEQVPASSPLPPGDEPMQLIEFIRNQDNSNTTIKLKGETIHAIQTKAGNRPLSIICICGPSRQGKSFMLGYMIRCLEALEKEETDWMDWDNKKRPLGGFKFRNGTKPETQGIWVWSRPFIVKNDDDKEVAVLLIDTQGTFDEFTTNKDMSAIVGLSLLTSSVMIFNLFTNLQEDVLSSLNTYTSYGQLALDNLKGGDTPFQKLIFLIRDWNNPGEQSYGAKGGKKFLEDKLKVKPDQPPEAKQVREAVKKCFKDLDCFLMPSIGEKALYESFTGSIDELAPQFARKMEEFINDMISSETLIIKQILGNDVTAAELVSFLEHYIGIFNSSEIPSAKSMFEATTDVHNNHMVRKAVDRFKDEVKKKLRGNSYLPQEDLDKAQAMAVKKALEVFKKARKFGGEEKIQECQDDLDKTISKEQKEMKKQNEEKRQKYLAGVISDAQTKFRALLEDVVPFEEEDEEDTLNFYEDSVINKEIKLAMDAVVAELKEKMENESEDVVETKVQTLIIILDDSIIATLVNKNKARRAEAEKKMASLVQELCAGMEERLKEFHDTNPFAGEDEVLEHHQNERAACLEKWKKAKKLGKKEFQKEFDGKLEKEVTSISTRFENEHKHKLQKWEMEGEKLVRDTAEAYPGMLAEKCESVEMEEEVDQIHNEMSSELIKDFAAQMNPYPEGHPLNTQLNQKLQQGLEKGLEYVKREVVKTQQRMEESYKEAVNQAINHYKEQMKENLESDGYLPEADLVAEHKLLKEEAVQEYEDYEKIGVPDNALNFKHELSEKLELEFQTFYLRNASNRELILLKAKNCVTDSRAKYEEAMKAEIDQMRNEEEVDDLHKDAVKKAKKFFQQNIPMKGDTQFVAKYEKELDDDIEETYEELKDLLEMKREQEQAVITTNLADCRKSYHDEMQKHCKNNSFIRPERLDTLHGAAKAVVIDRLERKMPLSNFQRTSLEEELNGLYLKYQTENDMKLNSSHGPPAIGIDLGTTYCCVAVFYRGSVIFIQNQEQGNSETTPSYVAFKPDGSKDVGDNAKQNAFKYPETTIYDAKRIIGRKMNDPELQKDMTFWPFLVEADDGIPKINVNGKLYFPEQISSELLKEFRVMAEKQLGLPPGSITKAVITVPAYFNDGQRQATVDAGELAGLEVLTILNEPTAAAIAYSMERLDNTARKVLIFDLGGGTFDVAVLEVTQKEIKVLGVDGDTHLGGEDFDQKVMEYCAEQFKADTGIDLMDGKDSTVKQERDDARRRLRRLKTNCEASKKNLTSGRTTNVSLDAIYDGEDLNVEVTRDTFEKLNEESFKKAIGIVEKALKDTGVRKEHIEDIVLVGGSTRIPKVQEMLKDYFGGKALNYSIHPDKAVAYGAAVKAAMLNGEQAKGHIDFDTIEDVTPMSLGIETADKRFSVIIPKNTTVPKRQKEDYVTAKDNQTSCHIKIYQGEEYMAASNELLGEFVLEGLPPGRAGKEGIDVWMEIDSMGILHVEAVSKSTKGKNSITVKENKQRMSKETKSRLLAEANPAA